MSRPFTFGSLFAGIGGFDLGLERAGMVCEWQVEIDPFCLKVLEKHWPDVERFENVKDCGKYNLLPVDLVCGGFPCQDVSVAGKRAGLAGKRSGLWFEMLRIIRELEPRWVLVENVPGLLSVDSGGGFGTVLRDLAKSGYDAEWRVLDSKYFGVPQRRRRVFIVANSGGIAPGKVFLEPDGEFLEKMERGLVSRCLTAEGQTNPSGGQRNQVVIANTIVARGPVDDRDGFRVRQPVIGTLKAAGVHTMSGIGYVGTVEGAGLDSDGMRKVARIPGKMDRSLKRLDKARWKTLGNAVTVPVVEWIGRRILKADKQWTQ